ncbi:MAG: hypothetical protein ACXVLQ_00675 [Bacteriovorax sp.]
MKNFYKISMVILVVGTLSACSVKSTNSKITSTTTATSPIGTGTGVGTGTGTIPGGTTPTSPSSNLCEEIIEGKCYHKASNIIASGGSYGQTWWTSAQYTAAGTGRSPNLFKTDAVFNVRIIPRSATAGTTSTFGKACSSYMMYATKLRVQLMLHKNGVTVGDIATLTSSSIDAASNLFQFNVPVSSDPLVLEVVNVLSDSRCTGKYGSIPSNCSTNPYLDIPINTNGPTECVAFDILYSTDETWSIQ